MGALCESEVDKMVDVNVPLIMNYRGGNVSKHKENNGLLGKLAHPEGFEPPTKWFEATYSIQLSYGCVSAGRQFNASKINI
jgi:hypothetical protein